LGHDAVYAVRFLLLQCTQRAGTTAAAEGGDKRHAYEAIGVTEYVVFDPDGDLLPDVLRAWRLEGGVYVPWQAAPDGWWHSASLEIALEATRPFLGVRDRDGQRIALPSAVRARAQQLEQEVAEEARLRVVAEQERAEEARQRAALEDQLRRLREPGGA